MGIYIYRNPTIAKWVRFSGNTIFDLHSCTVLSDEELTFLRKHNIELKQYGIFITFPSNELKTEYILRFT